MSGIENHYELYLTMRAIRIGGRLASEITVPAVILAVSYGKAGE